jgi:hypothetical protein
MMSQDPLRFEIPMASYRVMARLKAAARLPPYLGSSIRGSLAASFKTISCALSRNECSTCMLRTRCAYSYCFETPFVVADEFLGDVPYAPHPLIFDVPPPADYSRTAGPDTAVHFGLTLLAKANDFLPYFVLALVEMGRKGLTSRRVPFSICSVHRVLPEGDERLIFQEGDIAVADPGPLETKISAKALSTSVHVSFLTPTHMKFQGQIAKTPQFEPLIRSGLRRLSALSRIHAGCTFDVDRVQLFSQMQNVRLVEDATHWYSWQRYSNRQGTKHPMGGILGHAVFEGELGPFATILSACERLHLGKGTAFGMGKIALDVNRRQL